jgi:hypothetical protein
LKFTKKDLIPRKKVLDTVTVLGHICSILDNCALGSPARRVFITA